MHAGCGDGVGSGRVAFRAVICACDVVGSGRLAGSIERSLAARAWSGKCFRSVD